MNWLLSFLYIFMGVSIFIGIIYSMFKRRLDESRILRWFPLGIAALVMGLFPELFERILSLSGLGTNPNALFQAVIIIFLLIIVFNNAGEISQLRARTNELGMNVSILNAEVRRLTEITSALSASGDAPGDMDVIRRHTHTEHEENTYNTEKIGVSTVL
jgi:hypothetical protein